MRGGGRGKGKGERERGEERGKGRRGRRERGRERGEKEGGCLKERMEKRGRRKKRSYNVLIDSSLDGLRLHVHPHHSDKLPSSLQRINTVNQLCMCLVLNDDFSLKN